MKSLRRQWAVVAVGLAIAAFAARAELKEWVENIEATSPVMAAFFRSMPLPGGTVLFRMPPKETRPALTKLIAGAPSNADLIALRAHEAEYQLDFAAAEADWKRYAELAADRGAGELALADFYHRRLRPLDEVKALAVAAQALPPKDDHLKTPSGQRSWQAFQRSIAVVREQLLPVQVGIGQYRAWIAEYPREPQLYTQLLEYLKSEKQSGAIDDLITSYRKAFPWDEVFPITARGSLAVYEKAYQPLWPPELIKNYFAELRKAHALRTFLDSARAALTANPDDLNAATRIFHYYQQEGNLAAAQRVLIEFRLRKESRRWNATELSTLAILFERVAEYNEAARAWYALYSLPGVDRATSEKALAGIADVLLSAPEQPIRFGAGDLSFYRDVATLDPDPGFLNGILSLLLNSTDPAGRYAAEETASVAYFHRARAAELVALFDSRFPKSPQRPELKSRLMEAYAAYGANDGVIKAGREFLAAFPNAPQRVAVSLLMADAYARKNQATPEFAIYDALLKELAARADGVPLGEQGTPTPRSAPIARSPEYARVLDRYISRLVSLKQVPRALALYRQEIDRNPNDPGLYERLATFLDQNRLGEQVEQIYRRAMQQFPDLSWRDKLARWYLRRKQTAEFDKLTQEVVKVFSGSELERYFRDVVARGSLDAVLYRQLNLYAHNRFPRNLAFVKNLLYVYQQRGTADVVARERLLREHWFYDDELRARFFEFLTATGKLNSELEALRKSAANPAAAQFLGEAEAWRSHFESAAPALAASAAEYPGNVALGNTAASLERSLEHTTAAVAIEENLHRYDPRNHAPLTRMGEIYADHELFQRARPYWNQIAQISPGKSDGYLEAATVFWDYYQFDDALRLIAEGRTKLSSPALYAYETGAIYENKRDYAHAVEEYAKGALGAKPYAPARTRLIALARRPAQRTLADQVTAKLAAGQNPDPAAVSLRAAVLEAQNRRDDLEKFLTTLADGTTSLELLARVDEIATRQGFDSVRERSLQRQIAITADRVDRMRARLALMRYYEARRQPDAARGAIEALYSDNPTLLGVVRATVDFYWRNKMPERAIDVLTRAAAASYPALKKQFTLEAALKATDSGNYQRARDLLAPLLADEPFRGEYLAAMAQTYARAGDYRSLRDFYLAKIKADRASASLLRRALIPALTRLNDPAAAIDQYIELIKTYPEDESLAAEAAGYAEKYRRQPQLLAYFTKAMADSPRDSRWPMVLARLETQFVDFPAAIAAYTKASAIRPDRTDLLAARALLEERLMQFDEVAATYAKLYDLTYHDPQWMEKVAETRARQGRIEDAVAALKKALLEGRGDQPENYFEVARKLDSWNLLPQARPFVQRGVDLAGANLFTDYQSGAALYARILTRLRQYDAAFARLRNPGNAGGLIEVGATVKRYYSPEEKSAFAAFLSKQDAGAVRTKIAGAAGLLDLQARWLGEMLLANPGPQMQSTMYELTNLQTSRLRFDELGRQLEAYWKIYPEQTQGEGKDAILDRAADAYRSAGDSAAELRTSIRLPERYAELLVKFDPQSVPAAAWQGNSTFRNAIANAAVASGNADLALRAIIARGRGLPPVWTKAYTGLVGVYYRDTSPAVNSAFRDALGTAVIGERIGKPVDRAQQLAGDIWFYYGSRYGEYLQSEDYLPAELEEMPGNAAAYARLAKQYEGDAKPAPALVDYEHTLELNPNLGWVHDREAVLLWQQGRRDEAIAHWKAAFEKFTLQLNGRVPEEFWGNARAALENVGQRHLLPAVRDPADTLLRSYIHRNGRYRVEPLLEGAKAAAADPVAADDWIIDLARSAQDQLGFLEYAGAIFKDDPRILRRIVEVARELVAEAYGEEKIYRTGRLRSAQTTLAYWLVDHNQAQAAQAVATELPGDAKLEIRIAAATRSLDALIEKYRRGPAEEVPSFEIMKEAAAMLRERGDDASARRVLEFAYTRALDERDFSAGNFLGLAEIRLETGDVAAAVALLRRMTLISGAPFENLEPAAALLEKFKHPAEAAEFLAARRRALPWVEQAILPASGPTQPYAALARVTAAEHTADLATRVRLLMEAVAIQPLEGEDLFSLFDAAFATRQYPIVVSSMNLLMRTPFDVNRRSPDWRRKMAIAYEQLGRFNQAESYYKTALDDEKSAPVRAEIETALARLKTRDENAQRRPKVSEKLEQPAWVLPRLEVRGQ